MALARAIVGGTVKTAVRLSTLGLPTGLHVTRYAMYDHLGRVMRTTVDEKKGTFGHRPRVFSVSRSIDLVRAVNIIYGDLLDTDYPEYDLLNLHQIADETYDYVIADQVLEHVAGNPWKALAECKRVLKPGGVMVQTTCILEELHGGRDTDGEPHDYCRLTPKALRMACTDVGFSRIIDSGGWGNRLAFLGLRYLPVPHATWHPIHWLAMLNTKDAPIVTWVIAQK